MSAIIGIYLLDDRPIDRADLHRMSEVLAHRGSDATGLWSQECVGFGHRMLWTTPESGQERLPLTNKSGDLVITADARIDNRNELIAVLGAGHEEIGDSELILSAYERWGESCPEKLLGDFAFAIWDGRRQTVFCTRDHLGVRPLYYYRSERIFAFASEIKALLCLPEVPRRLNEVRVADYLTPILEDKTITFYEEIFRLPPGHCVSVGREGVRIRPYWTLDPSREVRLRSDEEYAEAFREIFTESVRCRLRSAFPIGAMLSGGLDSSSIVCVARQLLAKTGDSPLRTLSLIFDTLPECDERPFINVVIAGGSLSPHYVHGDRLSPLADLNRTLSCQDEPFFAPNLHLHEGLYREAHQQGIRVLLDGLDGDTTVSHGIAHLAEMARTGRWVALVPEITGLSKNFNVPLRRILWRHVIRPVAPGPVRKAWRLLGRRIRPVWDAAINPDFARRVELAARLDALLGKSSEPAGSLREEHWRRLTSGLIPYALNVADIAAAAVSVRPSYPFFDKRLVEFCLALPPAQKISRGWTRVVMRRALVDLLPEKVRWRGGKADLSSNFNSGLLNYDRGLLEDVILKDGRAIGRYLNLGALRESYQRCLSKITHEDAITIWKAATLAIWLARFERGQVHSDEPPKTQEQSSLLLPSHRKKGGDRHGCTRER